MSRSSAAFEGLARRGADRNGWLGLTTYVLTLPEPASLKATLMGRLLELNDSMSLAKFTKVKDGSTVTLDFEYREEHPDAAVLGNLIDITGDSS
ncbi:MAG: hypothetical protein GIX03_01135 [Candidatus Eremiobacteraeota bacterium]|nr:hypothetical protein [Candidatus Eremiobacteraeota bacterium]MBC5801626.1 hypothetical protein [Candidatus Eremiobacteraeota bacterium]MBC5821305.1 hypothetical protein [Candidatus Eremiobacteraeota bacterium]